MPIGPGGTFPGKPNDLIHLPHNLNFDMVCGNKEENVCVMLVKRFIDILPYLKGDRGSRYSMSTRIRLHGYGLES